MKKLPLQLSIFILLFVTSLSCNNSSEEKGDSAKAPTYHPLITELFAIECEHLKMEGVIPDTGIYGFRSAAFQAVLKDLDRTVLGRYEDIYQELSRLEHEMSEKERKEYDAYLSEVYSKPCR